MGLTATSETHSVLSHEEFKEKSVLKKRP